ncbi:transposase [Streptomyces sp. NPDC000618]|uniref:transposase n=1 Tax=Streptomyces sp. NPDC000618 TaxID=3154265 RepID=UPI0033271C18
MAVAGSGRREAYCHRAMLDAIRCLVDNGVKWRVMPAGFPPRDRVYAFCRRWRDHGLVREFHGRLRAEVGERLGRDAEPTAALIGSQSVRADAVVGAESRGCDGGKQINGRKRHVVVDILGLPLGGRHCLVGPVVVLLGLVRRAQRLADPRADIRPLLPIPFGHGGLGLDAVGLLPRVVHPTARTRFAVFRQSDHRRHPRPPQRRRQDKPSRPPDRRVDASPAKTQSSRPKGQRLLGCAPSLKGVVQGCGLGVSLVWPGSYVLSGCGWRRSRGCGCGSFRVC